MYWETRNEEAGNSIELYITGLLPSCSIIKISSLHSSCFLEDDEDDAEEESRYERVEGRRDPPSSSINLSNKSKIWGFQVDKKRKKVSTCQLRSFPRTNH